MVLSTLAAATATDSLSDSDALLGLITIEGLLFAALAVSVSLAGEFKTGKPKIVRGPKLAWAISATIAVVSFGAMMAWAELFLEPCPDGFRDFTVSITFAAGIIVQPFLAGWISSGVK